MTISESRVVITVIAYGFALSSVVHVTSSYPENLVDAWIVKACGYMG
jgi:hypothetical protein